MRYVFILLFPLVAFFMAFIALAAAVSGWDSGQPAFVLNIVCFSAPSAGLAIASCLAAYRLWRTDLPFWDAIHMQVVAALGLISVTLAAVGVAEIAGVTQDSIGARVTTLILGGVTCVLAGLAASVAYRLWKAGKPSWNAVRTQVLASLWLTAVSLIGFGIAVAVAAANSNDAEGAGFAFVLLVVPSIVIGLFAGSIAWTLSRMRVPSRRAGRAVTSLVLSAILFLLSLGALLFEQERLSPLFLGASVLLLMRFLSSLRRASPDSR